MRIKYVVFTVLLLVLCACTSSEEIEINTLKDLINLKSNLQQDEVIACAASKNNDNNTSYIFYYPIPSATNIQYFETDNTNVNKDDFSLYKPVNLSVENVFNGYLQRFVRENAKEVWCIVTYESEGKFHKSNPILLKNQTKPTEWTNDVVIDYPESLSPKFTWQDGLIKENVIYFQVITNELNELLSGTYTFQKNFQYYNLNNVVLNITRNTPPSLIKNNLYNFTMMGVSEDNWVNLVIEKSFTAQ